MTSAWVWIPDQVRDDKYRETTLSIPTILIKRRGKPKLLESVLIDGHLLLGKPKAVHDSWRNGIAEFGGSIMVRILLGVSAAASLALAFHVAAQDPTGSGSSFGIVGQPVQNDAILTSKSNGTLLKLKARPVLAVTLSEPVSPATSVLFGAKPDVPFDTTRTLYGWPERPGLFCDLLRNRGLGLSTACLRDIDNDGTFDEGRRFDFTSGSGDLLGITPSGKIIGVRTTAKPHAIPLPKPVAYKKADVPPTVTGQLTVNWRTIKVGETLTAQMWITTPDNYTGTEGVSERILQFPMTNAPLDVELYGIKIRVLGFNENGAMRYQVMDVRDGATVPLRFRGYILSE